MVRIAAKSIEPPALGKADVEEQLVLPAKLLAAKLDKLEKRLLGSPPCGSWALEAPGTTCWPRNKYITQLCILSSLPYLYGYSQTYNIT